MIIIGIDPGQQTGVATFVDGALISLETIQPHHIERLMRERSPARVIFEDSRLQSHIFSAHKPGIKRKLSHGAQLKVARNVGQIDAWCSLIFELCAEVGISCHSISPDQKGPKLDAKKFTTRTGWVGSSNQHGRDAAMVAWPYRGAAVRA